MTSTFHVRDYFKSIIRDKLKDKYPESNYHSSPINSNIFYSDYNLGDIHSCIVFRKSNIKLIGLFSVVMDNDFHIYMKSGSTINTLKEFEKFSCINGTDINYKFNSIFWFGENSNSIIYYDNINNIIDNNINNLIEPNDSDMYHTSDDDMPALIEDDTAEQSDETTLPSPPPLIDLHSQIVEPEGFNGPIYNKYYRSLEPTTSKTIFNSFEEAKTKVLEIVGQYTDICITKNWRGWMIRIGPIWVTSSQKQKKISNMEFSHITYTLNQNA